MDKIAILQMTADIVASHASINEMRQEDLLGEIEKVFGKLASLANHSGDSCEATEAASEGERPLAPAVPLAAAFGSDKVFCMVCGKGMKTLKRHLFSAHGMKPGQYRREFGIAPGTPLVAKNYSDKRKGMAKNQDLAERLVKARAARGRKTK